MNQGDKIGLGILGGAVALMVGLVAAGRRGAATPAAAGALDGGAGPIFIRGMPHGGQAYLDGRPVSGTWDDGAMTLWAIPASPGRHKLRVVRGKYDRSSIVDVQPGLPLWVNVDAEGLWPDRWAPPATTRPPQNPRGLAFPTPIPLDPRTPTTAIPLDPRTPTTAIPLDPRTPTTAIPLNPDAAWTAPPTPAAFWTAPPQDPRVPTAAPQNPYAGQQLWAGTVPPQDPRVPTAAPQNPYAGQQLWAGTVPPQDPRAPTAAPQDPRAPTAAPQDPRRAYTAPPQDPRAPTAAPQDPGAYAKTPRRPVKGVRPLDWMMGRF